MDKLFSIRKVWHGEMTVDKNLPVGSLLQITTVPDGYIIGAPKPNPYEGVTEIGNEKQSDLYGLAVFVFIQTLIFYSIYREIFVEERSKNCI